MGLPTHILLVYGYAVLFGWVLIEQLGVPLPAAPLILAAGALSAEHEMSFPLALLVGLVACIVADGSWFFIGRHYGRGVTRLLCKLSLEPTVCIRRTESSLGGRRQVTILFSKFIPGVSTMVPPLAGHGGMSFGEFFALDGLASLMWVGGLLVCGRFFGDVLKHNPGLLDQAGRFSGALLAAGVVGWFLMRLWRRHTTLKKLAATRMEPAELKQQMDAGEPVYVVDLRPAMELVYDPHTLPGAHNFAAGKVREWAAQVPKDTDVVVFCSCPGETSAAKTALDLQKYGIERVRPLRGGYDEWKRLGYPVDRADGVAGQALVQIGELRPEAEIAD
jgi:membrane protein DedA with SNARE-associated domain/rhodanese-related sulfurtransferase